MSSKPLTPELMHPAESRVEFSDNIFRDQQNRTNPNYGFPAPESGDGFPWPEKEAGATTLRYVFWRHTPENAPNLAEAIDGCDVLALEGTGNVDPGHPNLSNLKVRSRNRNILINGFLGAVLSDEEKRAYRHLSENNPVASSTDAQRQWVEGLDNVYGVALGGLVGSGTRLEWLDVELRHSQRMNKLDKQADEALTDFYYHFRAGASFDELVKAAISAKGEEAKTYDFREKIAQNQVERLVKTYPGSNIAIVYGASHLAMTRMISMPGLAMQRVFLSPEDDAQAIDRSKNINSVPNANTSILRATKSVSAPLIRLEVVDRMAFSLLKGKRDKKHLDRYCRLDFNERAELVGEIIELWKDRISLESPGFRKQIDKRLKATRKIIKSYAG